MSSSMFYGTFYHSLLTAEQYNVSPMALDLTAKVKAEMEGGPHAGFHTAMTGTTIITPPHPSSTTLFIKAAGNSTFHKTMLIKFIKGIHSDERQHA